MQTLSTYFNHAQGKEIRASCSPYKKPTRIIIHLFSPLQMFFLQSKPLYTYTQSALCKKCFKKMVMRYIIQRKQKRISFRVLVSEGQDRLILIEEE